MNDGLREREVLQQAKWDMLRSDIYIRDKGICWVCNTKVELRDYDLGHLIDRCNGGQDEYDNLATMHKRCNISKPRHSTLEEAMKWKLTPKYLTARPMAKPTPREQLSFIATSQPDIKPLEDKPKEAITTTNIQYTSTRYNINPWRKKPYNRAFIGYHKHSKEEDINAMRELTVEYFTNRPELLQGIVNHERGEAIRQLASSFDISESYIKEWIRDANLVPKNPPQVTDGSQYRYVLTHLNELLNKYDTVKHRFLYDQPQLMGLSHYSMDIMFYLAGQLEKVSHKNYPSIEKRVKQLHLPIRQSSIKRLPTNSVNLTTRVNPEILYHQLYPDLK